MPQTLVWEGLQESLADLTVWNGTEEKEALSVSAMPIGYSSVAEMIATPRPFMVAHRGGSSNWPECSLRAYTQAVAWGMPALEVSLNKTSDGVFFGLHDDYLDRTSTNASGNLRPNTMTWDTLQENYKIDMYGLHEPYMRVEELLDAYSGTHTIFVDLKSLWLEADLNSIFAILKSYPSWQNNMVIKCYGVGPSNAIKARSLGFKTWGYFYETDMANFSAYQGYFDYLGMDYAASQTAWNAILSYNKPTIGHIVIGQNGWNQTLTKGLNAKALGVMLAEVKGIKGTPKVFEDIVPPEPVTMLNEELELSDDLLLQG